LWALGPGQTDSKQVKKFDPQGRYSTTLN